MSLSSRIKPEETAFLVHTRSQSQAFPGGFVIEVGLPPALLPLTCSLCSGFSGGNCFLPCPEDLRAHPCWEERCGSLGSFLGLRVTVSSAVKFLFAGFYCGGGGRRQQRPLRFPPPAFYSVVLSFGLMSLCVTPTTRVQSPRLQSCRGLGAAFLYWSYLGVPGRAAGCEEAPGG